MLVSSARALSTFGAGLGFGLQLSIPVLAFPALYTVKTLSPRDRLHYTLRTYEAGAKAIPPVALTTAIGAAYASLVARRPAGYLPTNFVAQHRKSFLLATAVTTLLVPVWTVAHMMKNISQMKQAEKEIEASESPFRFPPQRERERESKSSRASITDAEAGNAKWDIDSMVETWLKQHTIRVALSATAFICSVLELVNA